MFTYLRPKFSILLLLIGIFMLFMPGYSLFPTYYEPFDEKRIFEIGLLLFAAIQLAVDGQFRKAWLQVFAGFAPIVKILLAFFFAMGLLSSAFAAVLPKYALQELTMFALLAILIVGIAAQIRLYGEEQTLPFLVLLIFFGTVIVSMSFFKHLFLDVHFSFWLEQPTFFRQFTNVRFFNHYQTWTFPLLALPFLLLPASLGRWKFLLFLPAVFWWTWLLFSGGRGTTLAMSVSILAVWFFFREKAYPWIAFQIRTLLGGVVAYYLLFQIIFPTQLRPVLTEPPDYARLDLWFSALDMAAANPLLGIAPQHYAFYHPVVNMAHPHNSSMQLLAEWGLPAAIAFFVVIMYCFRSWIRQTANCLKNDAVTSHHQHFLVALTASFVAGVVQAQVCGILVMPLSHISSSIIIGMMIAFGQKKTANTPLAEGWATPRKHLVFAGASLLIAGVFVWSLFPSIMQLDAHISKYLSIPGTDLILNPRFWNQGLIDLF